MMRMMIYAVLLLIFLKISLSDWKMHRILNRDLIWICMLAVPICLADPPGIFDRIPAGSLCSQYPDGAATVFHSRKFWRRGY